MKKHLLLFFLLAVIGRFSAWASMDYEKHWNFNPYQYPNNMTVIGIVNVDGLELSNDAVEVGAFCGPECRGSDMLHYFTQVNDYLVFLTVYGEDGDQITFRLYDHSTEQEIDVSSESMIFAMDDILGMPTNPYELNFIPFYVANATTNPIGSGTVSGTGRYLAHEAVTLTAAHNTGYRFVNWTENSEVIGTEPTLQFVIEGNRTIVANYEMKMYHVDVDVNVEVTGTATGNGDFQEGSNVTVAAIPSAGFEFSNWTENDVVVSNNANYTFAIMGDRELTANFRYSNTDTTAYACGNFSWHGQNHATSGVYYDTFNSQLGVDSIVALHLTVYPEYDFNLYETACDSFCWKNTWYYESGDYQDVHQSIYGCDSIYTLHLTINYTRPLEGFAFMMPADNYVNRYTDVECYWGGVTNASLYDFYFWADGEEKPTTPTVSNTTSVTARRSGLEHGMTYHWCVVAKSPCSELESPERTIVCQLNPSMSVIPNSNLDFGEVAVGQNASKTISVSGTALPEDISYRFLKNDYGQDSVFFSLSPSSNWNPLKGGTLQVTFEPVANQLYYNSAIRIASGTFVDTIYLTGSMANRYVFSTDVESSLYKAGDTITVTGHVSDVLGNDVPDLEVDVYLLVLGTRITRSTVSDIHGDYSITYVPRYSESGYYQVGSCERNKRSSDAHDSFDVPGMSRVTNSNIIWKIYQNDSVAGAIPIRNRSRIPLENIRVVPVSVPNGLEISFGSFGLGALETAELQYSFTGTSVSTGNSYQEAVFQLISDDGTTMNLTCYYYSHKRRGDLDVYPPSVTTTMKRNAQKVLSFQVTNSGNGETGPISIDLPDVEWMSVMGGDTLASIAPGDSVAFNISLFPDENVPLNEYSGNFAVNCANGNGFSIPYTIQATSDSTGVLVVDVTDDYTYNTNNGHGPHLAGASVSVVGYYSLKTVAQGLTDSDGIFRIDTIPEGYYYLTVRAQSHSEYNKGVIYVEGGKTNTQQIYMQFQAISYIWDVVPTEVEDEYEYTLVTQIKTNVPVPVVVIEGPTVFDTLAYGDTLRFSLTVSNRGLVDAYDTQIGFEINSDEYVFTPLYDVIDTLHPRSCEVVPCIMTRVSRNRFDTGPNSDACLEGVEFSFSWYHCNAQRKWVEHKRTFKVRSDQWCKEYIINLDREIQEIQDINDYIEDVTSTPIPPSFTPDSGSSHSGVAGNTTTPVMASSPQDCTPCWQVVASLIINIIDMFTPLPVAAAFDIGLAIGNSIDAWINSRSITLGNPLHLINELVSLFCDFKDTAEAFGEMITTNNTNIIDYERNRHSYTENWNSLFPNTLSDKLDWECNQFQVEYQSYSINHDKTIDAFDVLGTVTSITSFIEELSQCITFSNPNRDDVELDMVIDFLQESVNYYLSFYNEITNILKEEEWQEESDEVILDFLDNFMAVIDPADYMVSPQATQQLLTSSSFTTVNDSIMQRFVDRWNRSIQYWNDGIYTTSDLPEGYDNNFIQLDSTIMLPAVEALETAQSLGFDNVGSMYHAALNTVYGITDQHSDDVCAKISVQFKQTMTMTREAFEGTLKIFNGHSSDAMQDIDVNLTIKDHYGVDVTDLFQINVTSMEQITGVDGTGSLNAQTEGVVEFAMIPSIAAAPDTAAIYSFGGSFTFLDPFSGEEMAYQLYPVELTVNPSPNLYVDYFVQRNIISDDPLTEDTIEPMEEAEIAMMIRNVGNGNANNVYLESSQPEIIENQNNLLISFDMTGSAMNGVRRPLGLTNIPFGTIESHHAGIAEWYFTSSLIGRVINSTAHVVHNSSYGRTDLSLVSGVNTHELIKAVRAYGTLEDGINDFLVNEESDFGHIPDRLYFSNGDTTNIIQADSLRALDSVTHLNNTVVMNMYPHAAGWNYGTITDPGRGCYELVSCTRNDGQEIPLDNVWITRITIPHDDVPIHENILHIVDTLPTNEMATYTLKYSVDQYSVVTVIISPEDGGSVIGGGQYGLGTLVSLVAEPNEGYSFVSWTESGEIISVDPSISFISQRDRELVANFVLNTYSIQAYANSSDWGTVSGSGTYDHGTVCTLTAVPNEGFGVLNWTKDGVVVSTEPTHSFTVIEEGSYICNFAQIATSAMSLSQGWNWWSTYIYLDGEAGLSQLEENLSGKGDYIKSQRSGFAGFDEGDWYGNLLGLNNQSMYMIQTNTPVQLSMSGLPVDASQLAFDLPAGWNWIGYPLAASHSVNDVLSLMNPEDGDVLKSQTQVSIYEEDGWFGTLRNMNPGQGYMLNAQHSQTFAYNTDFRGGLEAEVEIEPHWNSKAYNYADNMCVVATVELDGEELRSDSYQVAAFCNGTSLSSARLLYNARHNRYYALLVVPGEEGMEIDFRLYRTDINYEYSQQAVETCVFAANDMAGSLDKPVILHFGVNHGVSENVAPLHLYPNPVERKGLVHLDIPTVHRDVRVEIYNVLDVLVDTRTITGNCFNVGESLSSGTYILLVFDGSEHIYFGKLIIR